MGQVRSQLYLEDFAAVRNESKQHKITEWDTNPPKNLNYYNGQRFFKVSRDLYPQYKRGWIFGYTIDPDYYKNILYDESED